MKVTPTVLSKPENLNPHVKFLSLACQINTVARFLLTTYEVFTRSIVGILGPNPTSEASVVIRPCVIFFKKRALMREAATILTSGHSTQPDHQYLKAKCSTNPSQRGDFDRPDVDRHKSVALSRVRRTSPQYTDLLGGYV